MIATFDNLYLQFKEKFVFKHGQAKFNAIVEKIHDSSKIGELNKASVQQRISPSHVDFGKTIQSIGYFIFSNSDTSAMAELIAAKYWNDSVNAKYGFCTEDSLYFIAEGILKKWKKFYTL